MNSTQLVSKGIRGDDVGGRTPLYGWVSANLSQPIAQQFGSVTAFEDHFGFDMAHIFGEPICTTHFVQDHCSITMLSGGMICSGLTKSPLYALGCAVGTAAF